MPRTCHYMRRKRAAGAGVTGSRPDVAVSHENATTEDPSIYDLDGGLRVTVERTWQLEVPCTFNDEASLRFTAMLNPHNQCGPLFAEQVPVVTGEDFDSFMAAFNKRCNVTHHDDIEDEELMQAFALINAIQCNFPAWDENPDDRATWESKFDSSKVDRMRAAMQEIDQATYRYLGTKDLSVKKEVLLKRNDPGWAARVIYAGNDAFNAMTGPAMMAVMQRLETLLSTNTIGGVRYCTAYKKTDTKLAEYIEQDNRSFPHVAEGDYSANDKHQRESVHLLFDAFLEKINMPKWLRNVFLENNKFKVRSFKLGVQATLKNQLPTGTTATTPRNTLYNILMFSTSCIQQHVQGLALVLGDDLLARTNRPINLQEWKDTVSRFKMVLKAKSPRMRGGATFLSKRLITGVEHPCMVPLLGKALARFNARAIYKEEQTHSQYMAGKSLSYAYEFRHVPFLRDFFLERYIGEDNTKMTIDELSWNTKTSGVDLGNIVQSIKDEPVLINDDDFLDWSMETYDLGLVDLEEVFSMVVLSDEPAMVTHPAVHNLSIDW
uniref:RNA-dependent RNA polymerase n=1 Tax=Erysiphe necator associated abispo virus 4 TaxID=2741920 RepID=A0A8E3YJ92_9VIRU|nr:RNA-dependent RNA polymerase [Erysiphe necator associated abispo virus 4]